VELLSLFIGHLQLRAFASLFFIAIDQCPQSSARRRPAGSVDVALQSGTVRLPFLVSEVRSETAIDRADAPNEFGVVFGQRVPIAENILPRVETGPVEERELQTADVIGFLTVSDARSVARLDPFEAIDTRDLGVSAFGPNP